MAPIAQAVSSIRRRGGNGFGTDPFVPGQPPGLPCEIPTPIPGVVFCAGNCQCAGIPIQTPFGTACGLGSCVPAGPGNGLGPQVPPPTFPQNGCPPGSKPDPAGTGGCVRDPATNGAPRGGGCPPRGTQAARILCPPGCHPNKADYFLKGGSFVAEGTRCVTNRRRNPLNPRALDRAAGRLRSAQRAVKFLQAAKIPKKRRR